MKPYVLLLTLVLCPAAVSAQEAPRPSAGLRTSSLPTAFVRDDRGVETRGKLLQLDKDGVVLLVDGAERRFDMARVNRVTRRGDSLKNGVITGAVVGLGLSTLAAASVDCGRSYSGCPPGGRVTIVALGTAFYMAVGVGIDALIQGRTVLYQAPAPQTMSRRLAGPGMNFRISW